MEHDQNIGTVGQLKLSFSAGVATVSANVALPGGLTAQVTVSDNAGSLLDQIEAAVAKALPSTAAIDPAIFAVIKSAIMAIQ